MGSSLLLAFCSVAVVVEAGFMHDPPDTRIVNGHEIEIEDAPWQVSFQNISRHICGGSIISTRWILTAAHCTKPLLKSQMTILIGTKSLEEGGTKYEVDEVVEHERYSGHPAHRNDISVVKTKTEMKLVLPVKAVTLPGPDAPRPAVKTQLRVSGWGELGNRTYPPLLRAVDVVVRDFQECRFDDDQTEICAWPVGKGFCRGDSGGPLVKGDIIVGVVSDFGGGQCGSGEDYYMNVAAFRNWIKTKTGV